MGLGVLADPLPGRAEAQLARAAPASGTGLVPEAIRAVASVIEVHAVFAVATTLSFRQAGKPISRLPRMNILYTVNETADRRS